MGFPGGSDGKGSVYNTRPGFNPWVRKIPELGRSLREGNGPHTSIFAWRIPWPEEHSSWGCKELGITDDTHTYSSPQWLWEVAFPPREQEGTLFSTTSPTFIVCGCF